MTSWYVIRLSEIAKILLFLLIPELDIQLSIKSFGLSKLQNDLALQIYKR